MAETECVGIIRFSYLGLEGVGTNGFAVKHQSTDEKRAWLYEPGRLKFRIDLFEAVTLQSLKSQTNQNYKCILMINDDFPSDQFQRLEQMIIGTPIIIEKMRTMRVIRGINLCFNKHFSADCKKRITFRLDDDDAISIHWIDALYNLASEMSYDDLEARSATIFSKKALFAHNNHNLANEFGYIFRLNLKNAWSVGTAVVSTSTKFRHAYMHLHTKIHNHFDAYPLREPNYILRVFHGLNNTYSDRLIKLYSKQIRQNDGADFSFLNYDLDELFGIDLESMLNALQIGEEDFMKSLGPSE